MQKNNKITPSDELSDSIDSAKDRREMKSESGSNVTPTEINDLRVSANDMPGDDENLREAALDNTDEDGTPLNEGSFKNNITASDLDIPGANLDDESKNPGKEDEDNSDYSLGGDNDDIPEDEF